MAKQTWDTFRDRVRVLLTHGGATVATPAEGTPYARTVIQLDGDSVWLVARGMAERREELDVHARAVARWYADTSGVAATAQRYVAGAQAIVATVVVMAGALYGFAIRAWVPVVIGVVVSLVLVPCARWLIGRLLRGRIRKALGS